MTDSHHQSDASPAPANLAASVGGAPPSNAPPPDGGDESAALSPFTLMGRRFARHRAGLFALHVQLVLFTLAAFCEFLAPTTREWSNLHFSYCPPQILKYSLQDGFHVDGLRRVDNPVTFARDYVPLAQNKIPLRFFVAGEPYRLWGVWPLKHHFFGIDRVKYAAQNPAANGPPPCFYLLGADKYGRDIFSRLIYGTRISLSVGLIAIAIMFVLGVTIGAFSGYAGGWIDTLIQRIIEIISALPQLPLWLALGAVLPAEWSPLTVYFCVTLVLSLLGWTGLAREVRGKILALREEEYAVAARLIGASHVRILFRHLVPGFASHIIVVLTLTVPGMILGETALSFLGLGLRPPIVSWGVLLQDCMSLQAISNYPWLLSPVLFIILTILAFNFSGDALRDAADPYSDR
jgi:peptide/nickel transport system permease protein